jgi:copper/silver efflux system protein
MIERLIAFSAHHRLFVIAVATVAALAGLRSLKRLPLDALPDVGDKQVIVYSQWDRSADLVDSQVTFPIVSALSGAPGVRSVRGISDFGASFVYVIFNDDADLYWARSRTLEYLSPVLSRLPADVTTELGPDASALGWVFQYVLVDRSGTHALAELRAFQDWYLRLHLKAVVGVAEVATVGGGVRQYQIEVDPDRLRRYRVTIPQFVQAIQGGNANVGGGIANSGGAEFMVRGLGQARSASDLEQVLVTTTQESAPVRVRDLGTVTVGTEPRRGVIDLDGAAEVVSGIVVMRRGENTLDVIDRVKAAIRHIELPAGVVIEPVYDRSDLVRQSIRGLRLTILEVTITVTIVILGFLWHLPSAVVAVTTLPLAVLIAFIPFPWLGVEANVMSLAGVSIATGALVDAAIVVAEHTQKRLAEWKEGGGPGEPHEVVLSAIRQVGRPCFYALLVIAVSFLPLLSLQGEAGRLFRPLVYAKSLAMMVAAVLAVTLTPALWLLFVRATPCRSGPQWFRRVVDATVVGQTSPEIRHPLTGWVAEIYQPIVVRTLDHKRIVVGVTIGLCIATGVLLPKLRSEFLPPFDEGVILYMPTMISGVSVAEAERLLRATDRVLKQIPEVGHVLGKAGRADSATDPAPLSMFETLIVLRPPGEWRRVPTWYSSWAPEWARGPLRLITSDRLSTSALIDEMDAAVRFPGVANAWSMPIRGRLDMLTTGIRTPLGLKVKGSSIQEIERVGGAVAEVLRGVPGTRGVFAERPGDGRFLDVRWNRAALAIAGISLENAQATVRYAFGGENITTVQEGRERYPVALRYPVAYRRDADALRGVLVSDATGQRHVPIGELAEVQTASGPSMVRDEDGLLTAYVSIDTSRRDLDRYVYDANRALANTVPLPAGYSLTWSGQFETLTATQTDLKLVVPLTLLSVVFLLWVSTRSIQKTCLVLLAVPFSAIGAIWAVYLLGYQISVPVIVGLVALLGIDAETGVFMLLYLDQAYQRTRRMRTTLTPEVLRGAIVEGASGRVRPKLMTAAALVMGLLPIMWSTGPAAELMKRIAAPMLGGILTSFLLELLVYPAVYHHWKSLEMIKASRVTR